MQLYKCKCGESFSWGSMPPKKCRGCPKCDTVPALAGLPHRKPEPHKFVTRYDEITGKPYEVCLVCHERKGNEDSIS